MALGFNQAIVGICQHGSGCGGYDVVAIGIPAGEFGTALKRFSFGQRCDPLSESAHLHRIDMLADEHGDF